MNPRVTFDQSLINDKKYILGIDEVGWGCVAGPVVLCGCLVTKEFFDNYLELAKKYPILEEVRDSKKLRENKRKEMFAFLTTFKEVNFFVGIADVNYINAHKLARAYTLSFDQIVSHFKEDVEKIKQVSFDEVKVIIDGNRHPKSDLIKDYELVIKGDDKSFSVALASLFAKEYRDSFMRNLEIENPENYSKYEFPKNKGYGTPEHTKLIKQFGLSDQHRTEATKKLIQD